MFEQGASGSQFAHILRVRERQFSPGAMLYGRRGLQHVLHVWLEVELLAAHQDLDGERQRFEKRAIPCDHGLLFFFRPERVIGGGDLKDRPVLTLRWAGRRGRQRPDTARYVRCRGRAQTRTGHCPFWTLAAW